MAQENTANGNGRLVEETSEAEWFPNPQPNPHLAELIRLVQEAIEARKRTEEEEQEKGKGVLPAREEVPQREEPSQRSSPFPRRVRYNLD